MENEDRTTTPKMQDAPRSPEEASITLPTCVSNTKNSLDMECGVDVSTHHTTQARENVRQSSTVSVQEEEVPTPLPSQFGEPKVSQDSSTDMESEDCGLAFDGQDATQSEEVSGLSIPLSSQANSQNLSMESEDCAVTLTNEHTTTVCPTDVPNGQSNGHNLDMGSEDYSVTAVNQNNTASPHHVEGPVPLSNQSDCNDSFSMGNEACAAFTSTNQNTPTPHPADVSVPLLNQDKEMSGSMKPTDSPSHQIMALPPTDSTSHPIVALPPTDGPSHPIMALPPTDSTSHPITALPPTDSTSHPITALPPTDSTSHPITALPPTDSTSQTIETLPPTDSPSHPIMALLPTDSTSHPTVTLPPTDSTAHPTVALPPTDSPSHPTVALLLPSDSPSHPTVTLPPTDTADPKNMSCEGSVDNHTRPKAGKKARKGLKMKITSASKGIQTSVHLLNSNSVFHDRVIDLPMLKREAGVVSVETLQDLDVALEEWPILLVSQLKLRDTIIESLNSVVRELVEHGQVLEQDLDYLKLKILELRQEVKVKAKENWQQSHKKQRKIAESQTTEEDLSEAWSRWYYGCWGDYYSECDPTSSSYWPGHYTQQSTVLNKTKATENEEMQQKVMEEHHEGNEGEPQGLNCKKNEKEMESKKEDLTHQHAESDNIKSSVKRKKLKGKRKKERHKSEKPSKEQASAEKHERESLHEGKRMRRRKKANKERDDRKEESDDTQTTDSSANTQLTQENINTSSARSSKEMNGKEEEEERKEGSHGWDASHSITQQVVTAAAQAVVDSGYVFQEELGLYYDYNTGYYYNAESGLYYDTKSGTYFYYDHDTQSYQFHSQVSPSMTSTTTKRRKKRTAKKDSRKLNYKNEDLREKEEGECTESDDEGKGEEEEEGEIEEEEREEGNMTSPDHQDEEAPAAADVPPSLRLMVVEGGERVRVGELHVVTLNGGTVGREVTNDVHLPDLNISKVHAEIEYRSAGTDDHHYYLRDLGSNNGTFVNSVRLSEARQASRQVEVGHGWEVQFGSIKVKCHLHPGTLTCNECEPGLVLQGLPSQPGEGIASFKNSKCKERARRKELKAMQKKYKLTHREAQASSSAPAPGYTDRSLLRQAQKGSDNPYEKTEVASSEVPLRETNRGFALLQKMGWSQGQGLGKSNTGIIEPVQPASVVGQVGLGSTQPSVLPPADPWAERRRKQLQITQERYKQSPPANH